MSVISGFMEYYTQKIDFYREAARICAQICETNLEQIGIRTIVTSRAKKPDRLRDKLMKRGTAGKYGSIDDIIEDIADLSGVRIALYFPGDLSKVQQFIETNFLVKECKIFPETLPNQNNLDTEYKKRFSGYWATHYRIYMKGQNIPDEAKRYSDTLIEIQVASALMHAWAEVEHDLVYKPYSGELSYEELQILDELNGLVLAGEIALERLQKAVKNRVSEVGKEFNNHYELAMFLYNRLGSATEASLRENALGRVDLLFLCIKTSEYNKPEKLKELLQHIDPASGSRTVVDQMIDRIREIHPELYERYLDVKQSDELKYQLETLQMNRENGNRQGEANTLANIGYIYNSKGNYDEAIQYFAKAVEINHEIGGVQGEANQLLNLASTYRQKGEQEMAMEYCKKAFALHSTINYKQGQANTLAMLGNVYLDLMNFADALTYYEEALSIFRETDYKAGEVLQMNNLGALHMKLHQIDQALVYYRRSLEVCREFHILQGEEEALHCIGNIYLEQGEPEEAITYYEKALSVSEASGSQKKKSGIYVSLGAAYENLDRKKEAYRCYKEAFSISSSLEFKNGVEEALRKMNFLQEYRS